jgi:hypothetical protein
MPLSSSLHKCFTSNGLRYVVRADRISSAAILTVVAQFSAILSQDASPQVEGKSDRLDGVIGRASDKDW